MTAEPMRPSPGGSSPAVGLPGRGAVRMKDARRSLRSPAGVGSSVERPSVATSDVVSGVGLARVESCHPVEGVAPDPVRGIQEVVTLTSI